MQGTAMVAAGAEGGHANGKSPPPEPVRAGPAAVGKPTQQGDSCELPPDEDAGPHECRMDESDTGPQECRMDEFELKRLQDEDALQRALNLGFKDGHAGKSDDPSQTDQWPEATTEINGVKSISFLATPLKSSYARGYKQGKAVREREALAGKLNMKPENVKENWDKQQLDRAVSAHAMGTADGGTGKPAQPPKATPGVPGQDKIIEAYNLGYNTAREKAVKAHNYGFADGVAGTNQTQIGKAEQIDESATELLLAWYYKGFLNGQAARTKAAGEGATDAKVDASSNFPTPLSDKQIKTLVTKHVSGKKEFAGSPWSKELLKIYVDGYVTGIQDFYATLKMPQNQTGMSANTYTKEELEQGRWLMKVREDPGWMNELQKDLRDHPPHAEHETEYPYEPPEID
jgi:ribosome modulation factor